MRVEVTDEQYNGYRKYMLEYMGYFKCASHAEIRLWETYKGLCEALQEIRDNDRVDQDAKDNAQ